MVALGLVLFVGVGGFSEAVFSALEARLTFFLRRQEESKQRRRRPWVGAGCAGSLRYSPLAGAAELGPLGLRQSSPFIRQRLRYLAPLKGPGKPSVLDGWFGFSNLGIFSARP